MSRCTCEYIFFWNKNYILKTFKWNWSECIFNNRFYNSQTHTHTLFHFHGKQYNFFYCMSHRCLSVIISLRIVAWIMNCKRMKMFLWARCKSGASSHPTAMSLRIHFVEIKWDLCLYLSLYPTWSWFTTKQIETLEICFISIFNLNNCTYLSIQFVFIP